MQPKISVVIPIYNAEKFLEKCLDSVISQPMQGLEIICVNDGSTDDSPQMLDEYAKKDSRIRVIHQPNLHAGIARNNGLELATGEYVHFLDADDYLTDNAYMETYRIAQRFELDWLKTKSYIIDAFTGELISGYYADINAQCMMLPEDYEIPFSFPESPEKLTTAPVFPPWAGLYRKAFLMENNIRFDSLYCCNDHSFYFAAGVRAQRIMVADVYMVWHRWNNPNSLVGNYSKRLEGCLEAFRIISEDCRFLHKRLYALVLIAELQVVIYQYRWNMFNKIDPERSRHLMGGFVRTFDFSLVDVVDVGDNELWYIEYLLLKLEMRRKDGTLSGNDAKDLIAQIKKRSLRMIAPATEKIQPESRVVIYGAGRLGRIMHEALQATGACQIVKWVDRDWEELSKDGLSVSSPGRVTNTSFDYVFIAIERPAIVAEVESWLAGKGISKKKIISNAEK